MILQLRKIVSINERFAYSLLGKIRQFVLMPFNSFLNFQIKSTKKKLLNKTNLIRKRLLHTLPSVNKNDLIDVLTTIESKQIIVEADKIISGDFKIFSKQINFKDGIDWHLDFNSGFRWPKGKLYSKYTQVDINTDADVKFPRELSRCHHFLYLGEAYILSNDERYTKEFINHVKSWISENPYKKSINWGCSMDIAIRASNWIHSLRMFAKSPLVNDDFFHEIITSLYLHGRFIYEHPEKNRAYNHNHYLSDLAGQILISLLFDELEIDETKLWKEDGIYELFREIRLQILPTGYSYERTTNYHRLVTELISYTIIVLKKSQIEIPQDITFRIKKMFESILYYLLPDGTAPIIGDQDNGRFLPFYTYDMNYQKYLMNVGAVLFDDGIFKYYSGRNSIDVLFLFGVNGIEKYRNLIPELKKLESKSFSDAGFYLMKSTNVYLFINNSGLSHYNEVKGGTHTHSDLLSFVYAYNKVPFLIDPGTYVYSSNPKERMKFRSTAMHNTITVDGYDQNDLKQKELWSIKRDAIPQEIIWTSSDEMDIYEGTHTGYERLQNPVKLNRHFELDKIDNVLKITDKIEGEGKHSIESHLHFDENVKIKIVNNVIYCNNKSEHIKISFEINRTYSIEFKDEYISKSYGQKVLAPYIIIIIINNIDEPVKLTTTIQKSENNETNISD